MSKRSLGMGLSILAGLAALPAFAQPAFDMTGRVQTANGPIEPDALGHTLMHEHIFIDRNRPGDSPALRLPATVIQRYEAPLTLDILSAVMLGAPNRDNLRLTDERTALTEVGEFSARGGSALVDATGIGAGRNPAALRRVATATRTHIILGAGGYDPAHYPPGLELQSAQRIAEGMVREITLGIEDSGAKAGLIGEIIAGTHPAEGVENRILRAAVQASRITGAAVWLQVPGKTGQHGLLLDLLSAEGQDLSRVVLGHADDLAGQLPLLRSLLDRGATLAFDQIGEPPLVTRERPIDFEVARTIMALVTAGYADRLLLSQGVATKTRLKAYGGTGYSFIEESFLPYLKRQGLSEAQVEQIMVRNPRRLLTFAAPVQP